MLVLNSGLQLNAWRALDLDSYRGLSCALFEGLVLLELSESLDNDRGKLTELLIELTIQRQRVGPTVGKGKVLSGTRVKPEAKNGVTALVLKAVWPIFLLGWEGSYDEHTAFAFGSAPHFLLKPCEFIGTPGGF